jgi:hypothetical protein
LSLARVRKKKREGDVSSRTRDEEASAVWLCRGGVDDDDDERGRSEGNELGGLFVCCCIGKGKGKGTTEERKTTRPSKQRLRELP